MPSLFSVSQDERVDKNVPNYDRYSRNEFEVAGHAAGVDEGFDIVLDKSTPISCVTCLGTKIVFKRRERADPAAKIDD